MGLPGASGGLFSPQPLLFRGVQGCHLAAQKKKLYKALQRYKNGTLKMSRRGFQELLGSHSSHSLCFLERSKMPFGSP